MVFIRPEEPYGVSLDEKILTIFERNGICYYAVGKWHLEYFARIHTNIPRFDSLWVLQGAEDYITTDLDTIPKIHGLDLLRY